MRIELLIIFLIFSIVLISISRDNTIDVDEVSDFSLVKLEGEKNSFLRSEDNSDFTVGLLGDKESSLVFSSTGIERDAIIINSEKGGIDIDSNLGIDIDSYLGIDIDSDLGIDIDSSNKITLNSEYIELNSSSVSFITKSFIVEGDNTIRMNSNDVNTPALLKFEKIRSNSGVVGDDIGKLEFYGDNSLNIQTLYGQILCEVADATAGSEDGKISLGILKGVDIKNKIIIEVDNTNTKLSLGNESNLTHTTINIRESFYTYGDVTFRGTTADNYINWNATTDHLIINNISLTVQGGNMKLVGTTHDYFLRWNNTDNKLEIGLHTNIIFNYSSDTSGKYSKITKNSNSLLIQDPEVFSLSSLRNVITMDTMNIVSPLITIYSAADNEGTVFNTRKFSIRSGVGGDGDGGSILNPIPDQYGLHNEVYNFSNSASTEPLLHLGSKDDDDGNGAAINSVHLEISQPTETEVSASLFWAPPWIDLALPIFYVHGVGVTEYPSYHAGIRDNNGSWLHSDIYDPTEWVENNDDHEWGLGVRVSQEWPLHKTSASNPTWAPGRYLPRGNYSAPDWWDYGAYGAYPNGQGYLHDGDLDEDHWRYVAYIDTDKTTLTDAAGLIHLIMTPACVGRVTYKIDPESPTVGEIITGVFTILGKAIAGSLFPPVGAYFIIDDAVSGSVPPVITVADSLQLVAGRFAPMPTLSPGDIYGLAGVTQSTGPGSRVAYAVRMEITITFKNPYPTVPVVICNPLGGAFPLALKVTPRVKTVTKTNFTIELAWISAEVEELAWVVKSDNFGEGASFFISYNVFEVTNI